eukprot:2399262-Pleurochrysis_carterae.AAC.2
MARRQTTYPSAVLPGARSQATNLLSGQKAPDRRQILQRWEQFKTYTRYLCNSLPSALSEKRLFVHRSHHIRLTWKPSGSFGGARYPSTYTCSPASTNTRACITVQLTTSPYALQITTEETHDDLSMDHAFSPP